jgi:hypothetical protein
VCFALSLWGAYDVFRGNAEVGWALLAITGLLLGILLLVQIVVLVRASTRWAFRCAGYSADDQKRLRKRAKQTVVAVFWIWIFGSMVLVLRPYLSLSPARSWYGFVNKVPADRVTLDKIPHDCEFQTAPLGSKHCHYAAQVLVVPSEDNPDKQKSVLVTYERIED